MRQIVAAVWRLFVTARSPGQIEQAGIDLRQAIKAWRDAREQQRRGRAFERHVESRPGRVWFPGDF